MIWCWRHRRSGRPRCSRASARGWPRPRLARPRWCCARHPGSFGFDFDQCPAGRTRAVGTKPRTRKRRARAPLDSSLTGLTAEQRAARRHTTVRTVAYDPLRLQNTLRLTRSDLANEVGHQDALRPLSLTRSLSQPSGWPAASGALAPLSLSAVVGQHRALPHNHEISSRPGRTR